MAPNPTDELHAITVGGTQEKEDLQILLSFIGAVSYFLTMNPTGQEWKASEFSRQIELTAETTRVGSFNISLQGARSQHV